MALAVQAGLQGWGRVSPNPLVGCVILSARGELLASGAHHRYGDLHAETDALRKVATAQLKGAKVYVTLEPCAHRGKQPACAVKLAELPIAEVIYGTADPNPKVAGKGLEFLKNAGISVRHLPECEEDCLVLAEHFHLNMNLQRTFVSVKIAASLDGQMALPIAERVLITSTEARLEVARLRAGHDAILVGARTVLADDPRYTVRHPEFLDVKKKLVVLDPSGELKKRPGLKIFSLHSSENLIVIENCRDLGRVLDDLWQREIKSVFVESGPKLTNSFLNQNCWDRMYLFQATKFLGSDSGRRWSNSSKLTSMGQIQSLHKVEVQTFGSDVLISARREPVTYGRRRTLK